MDNLPAVDKTMMAFFQQTVTHAVMTYMGESAPVVHNVSHMIVQAACTQGNL